jgi:serine phosphatase RsbU (regulator of sigma subunit)
MNPADFKILVVEDNSFNRRVIMRKLEKSHFQVNDAEDGNQALEKVKSWQPDLILLDIIMPELDGLEVLQIIRKTKSQVELPIILVTAMQDSEDVVKGFKLGANDYLPKNFNTEELLARVTTGLQIRNYHKLLQERNTTIERELDIARLIQKKILPVSAPSIPGYAIGSLYVPMDKVGGDYYDYNETPDYCDFFMADVSGHGVPGALLASILKMSIQHLHETHNEPTEILKVMDKAVFERGTNGMFATAMIVRLFPKEGRIIYSNAGHHPLIVQRRSDDSFISLTTKGAPLGINFDLRRMNYQIGEFKLEKGDRLILFTDGIIEAMDENNVEFDTNEWLPFLKNNKDATIESLSESLITTLQNYSKKITFEDDLTWIVIDYPGL